MQYSSYTLDLRDLNCSLQWQIKCMTMVQLIRGRLTFENSSKVHVHEAFMFIIKTQSRMVSL